MSERIPIKQGGKIVGYVNPPLWLRLWQALWNCAYSTGQALKLRITRVWKWIGRQR